MLGLNQRMKRQIARAIERDRSLDGYAQAASRRLWPWQEFWLVALASLVVVLDYTSTYAILELSGKSNVYEAGFLAGWALQTGGFEALLLVDITAVLVLSLAAVAARRFCFKFGFRGHGRAAFVILLVPYVVVTFGAITNNVALTFL